MFSTMNTIYRYKALPLILLATMCLLFTSCQASKQTAEAKSRRYQMYLEDRSVGSSSGFTVPKEVININVGDEFDWRILRSDEAGLVRIAGYEEEGKMVQAGNTISFFFTADKAGSFDVTFTPEDKEILLFKLVVAEN